MKRIQGGLPPLLKVYVFLSLSSPCSDEHMLCIQKVWILKYPSSFLIIVHMVSYQDDIWRWHFCNSFYGWRQRTNTFQPSQTLPSQFSSIGAPTWCLLHPDHLAMARMVWRNSSWHLCRWRNLESPGTCFHQQSLSWQRLGQSDFKVMPLNRRFNQRIKWSATSVVASSFELNQRVLLLHLGIQTWPLVHQATKTVRRYLS